MVHQDWHAAVQRYQVARSQDNAWRLLAAKRAPLILACADELFAQPHQAVSLESAIQLLADMFRAFANDATLEINSDDYHLLARREWRSWIKRGLLIERDNQVLATDALQKAMRFAHSLNQQQVMTSTASRLASVQREIKHLATHLNPNQTERAQLLREQIAALNAELAAVEQGKVPVLNDQQAAEGISDVYIQAMSLRDDFRRVEDSYRAADRDLRESIIRDAYHRGDVVEALLDSHEQLIRTPEGQVFQGFYEELRRGVGFADLRQHIRRILNHPSAKAVLSAEQSSNFQWLVVHLNNEAEQVNRARQRSERDVRGFLQSGLAAEHHRVGLLLKDLAAAALRVDWSQQAVRRTPADLAPCGAGLEQVALIERLRIKEHNAHNDEDIALNVQHTDLSSIDPSFWQAFDGLNRSDWRNKTIALLHEQQQALSLAALAQHLPPDPRYDLEAIAMWLEMARAAQCKIDADERELCSLKDEQGRCWQFSLPLVRLDASMCATLPE